VEVDEGVELSLLTQSNIRSDTASLNSSLYVAEGGFLDLPVKASYFTLSLLASASVSTLFSFSMTILKIMNVCV
jgi:hypothetical protein